MIKFWMSEKHLVVSTKIWYTYPCESGPLIAIFPLKLSTKYPPHWTFDEDSVRINNVKVNLSYLIKGYKYD